MSQANLKKMVLDAINDNPLAMQETFADEMAERVRQALEEKYKKTMKSESEDEDDEDEDDEDEDEDDMEESNCKK